MFYDAVENSERTLRSLRGVIASRGSSFSWRFTKSPTRSAPVRGGALALERQAPVHLVLERGDLGLERVNASPITAHPTEAQARPGEEAEEPALAAALSSGAGV